MMTSYQQANNDEILRNAQWVDHFPKLRELSDECLGGLCFSAKEAEVQANSTLFREGDRARSFLFCIDGAVKISKSSGNGREMLLYRITPGKTCVLTTSVLLSDSFYPAQSIAEVKTRAMTVPRNVFLRTLNDSSEFRDFVFAEYGGTLCDMIKLIDDIAFVRVDVRLASLLLARREKDDRIVVSHRDLAVELGTAREVVSRQLKAFEDRGWIKLGRRRVELIDADALSLLACT